MHDTHDVRKSQELAEKERIPTERDYQRYIGDSFKEFNEALEELSKRLADLEEKERQRARDEHARELSFDQWAEGSAIMLEKDEKVRCIECKTFVSYEDAYVEGHSVDEDGQTVEDCICKWCKKEGFD